MHNQMQDAMRASFKAESKGKKCMIFLVAAFYTCWCLAAAAAYLVRYANVKDQQSYYDNYKSGSCLTWLPILWGCPDATYYDVAFESGPWTDDTLAAQYKQESFDYSL